MMKLNKLIIEEINSYIDNIIIENMILLEASLTDIYQKYYSNMSKDIFDMLIQTDPTYRTDKPDKMGKYGKWIIDLYKRGEIKNNDDLIKTNDYLSVFVRYYNRIENKNINSFKTLDELYNNIAEFYTNQNQSTSKSDETRKIKEGAEKVYEDDKWLVIIPHTKEASCYYGKHTKWCTASDTYQNMFDYYNENGNLYINIDKVNNKKYQFHFESNSFMDEEDKQIYNPICDTIGMSDGLKQFYLANVKYSGLMLDIISRTKYVESQLQNNVSIKDIFDEIDNINNDLTKVKLNDKYNFIDRNANLLSDQWFDYIGNFVNGLAIVKINDKYNFIDTNCNFLYKPNNFNEWFNFISNFEDGFATVMKNGYFNYIDTNWHLLSDQWFNRVGKFTNGFAMVMLNKKRNFIDKNGNILYKPNNHEEWFDEVFNFFNGFAIVKLNGKYNFIDENANILSNQWFDYISNFANGLAEVSLNGKLNLINKNGRIIHNPNNPEEWFDFISYSGKNLYNVLLNGKPYILDNNGILHKK